MRVVTLVLLAVVALEHRDFLYLEMFRWTRAADGESVQDHRCAVAESSKKLAMNQGLYNGFLAAGLIWGNFVLPPLRQPVAIFFASCVLIAGVFGGMTVTRRILADSGAARGVAR